MSSAFLSALGIAISVSVCSLLLKGLGSSVTPVVVCIGAVGILSLCASGLVSFGEAVDGLIGSTGGEYARRAVKIVGIGYLSGICAEVCDTLGQASISRAVLLAGRLEILLVALPCFLEIVDLSMSLIG